MMDFWWLLLLLATHCVAYCMGRNERSDDVEMYDITLKWEHEKWLAERKDKRDAGEL